MSPEIVMLIGFAANISAMAIGFGRVVASIEHRFTKLEVTQTLLVKEMDKFHVQFERHST